MLDYYSSGFRDFNYFDIGKSVLAPRQEQGANICVTDSNYIWRGL